MYENLDGTLSDLQQIFRLYLAKKIFLLPILRDFCRQNSLRLEILGKTENSLLEQDFYSKILGAEGYTYIPRKSRYANYFAVDSALCVVSIDSTLGYEALARGARTAFFPIRGSAGQTEGTQFAWPAQIPPDGDFWTSKAEKSNILRVMEFITNVDDESWEQTCREYSPLIMHLDPGNLKLRALFERIGVSKSIPARTI